MTHNVAYLVVRVMDNGYMYNIAAFTTRELAIAHIQKMARLNPNSEFQVEEIDFLG